MRRENFKKRANNNGQNVVPKQPARCDVEEEMQRLVNGYKKHVGSSKIKSFMTEAFSLVKIPDWQKSKHWMVRNRIALCSRHFESYGYKKEWGTLGRQTTGGGGPWTGAPSPRKPPSSLTLFFLGILLPSTCSEGFRNGKTYLTYSNLWKKNILWKSCAEWGPKWLLM